VAVRYPRGSGTDIEAGKDLVRLPYGKGEIVRTGKRVAVLAFGTLLQAAKPAADALDMTLVNMRWAKPLDEALIDEILSSHEAIVTIEEGAIAGGAGEAVAAYLQCKQQPHPVLTLGLPDVFIEHGDPVKLLANVGLSPAGIQSAVESRFY